MNRSYLTQAEKRTLRTLHTLRRERIVGPHVAKPWYAYGSVVDGSLVTRGTLT